MTPFPGRVSAPSSFVPLFIFYILSYLLSKTMGCFSGCLMSSTSGHKLFCEVCSVFKCSFHEFVGEKVVSPSYSSAILASPPTLHLLFWPLSILFSSCLYYLLHVCTTAFFTTPELNDSVTFNFYFLINIFEYNNVFKCRYSFNLNMTHIEM